MKKEGGDTTKVLGGLVKVIEEGMAEWEDLKLTHKGVFVRIQLQGEDDYKIFISMKKKW